MIDTPLHEWMAPFKGTILGSETPVPNELYLTVKPGTCAEICKYLYDRQGASLVAMVGSDERPLNEGFNLYYFFSLPSPGAPTPQNSRFFLNLRTKVDERHPEFTSITPWIPAAHWYEREIQDLLGLKPVGHPDPRRLVLHENWPEGLYPLRKDFDYKTQPPRAQEDFEMNPVEGEGVFEIPVGPVHAGIIEPGHFRFSSVGEEILNLEARLFYKHKGTEKLAETLPFTQGLFLAERICGVCSFSHATSYCQALEKIAGVEIPERAQHLRTILLELERLYNHVGDVGNICAGTGLLVGNAQGTLLKEKLMQLNEIITGNRYLRGMNTIGGLRRDLSEKQRLLILSTLRQIEKEFKELTDVIMFLSTQRDRLETTGVLPRTVARDLGVVGVAARASGLDSDLRRDHPYAAYDKVSFKVPLRTEGDVSARVWVRIEEAFESVHIIEQLLETLPRGDIRVEVKELPPYKSVLGYTESPRGANLHWIMTSSGSYLYRYKIRSASYVNWPAVPLTVPGNIVPDFPLINKSFNLCYSCTDL